MFDLERFQRPTAEYRIHPFWFWNGDMDDAEIRLQIEEMADKGVGGFFVCARQGLKIPYLSQAWFDKVRIAVEAAKQHRMHVWLYDEYPYPSGMAGGEVTLEHPDAKQYTLTHRIERVSGGSFLSLELPWGRVVYAKAVPVSPAGERLWADAVDIRRFIGNFQAEPVFQKAGLTAYNQKRFFTYRTVQKILWDVPAGNWDVVIVLEKEVGEFKYYGTFVDPCHREAMKTFIRLTHERYAEHLGEYFGDPIKGMFTDEIGLLGGIPWSPQLAEFFRQKHGYDIREHMHALLFDDVRHAAKIRYDYYQSVHLLLRESYHEQVREWCDRHGLQYVAEVPSVRMTTQRFSHVPGGDSAHEKLGRSLEWIIDRYTRNMRNNPKMVSSLARQLGSERNLIECFHSVGWSMTLQDAKWMIDRMAALGTNFYNFHAFFYTLDGMTQHDAPPSQFLQNPYWAHFRQLGDYTGRISYLMSRGRAEIRIAVLDPVTSFWTRMGNPFHGFRYGGTDPKERERLETLVRDWSAIGKHLLMNRRDFDHLDPEMLAEARIADGAISVGHAEYSVLIVPPVTNLEGAAWKKIKEFLQAGGIVIGLGLLPYEEIDDYGPIEREALDTFGAESPTAPLYWGQSPDGVSAPEAFWTKGENSAYFLPYAAADGTGDVLERLMSLLDRLSPPVAVWEAEKDSRCFLMQTRAISENTAAIFISNQEGEDIQGSLVVDPGLLRNFRQLPDSGGVRFDELSLESGESRPIAAKKRGDRWEVPLRFAPYESRLVQVTAGQVPEAPAKEEAAPAAASWEQPWVWEVNAAEPWQMSAQAHNAVRFDTFRLTIGGGHGEGGGHSGESGFPVQAKTFIDQCADLAGNRSFPVHFQQTFGTPMKMRMAYPVKCSYAVEFSVAHMPEQCRLFMDRSAISGSWTIRLNGQPLTAEHFQPLRIYDQANISCDVTRLLRPGVNQLAVEVDIENDWDGVTDALYLGGPFGVTFDEHRRPVLTVPPGQAAALTGGVYEGYPYYAGTLTFSRTVELSPLPSASTFELVFRNWDPHFHDCAEVLVNGRSLGVRPWTPYRWTGPSEWLRQGENVVEVRVTNTLIGLLEGKIFDYASHTLQPVQG